MKEYFRWHQEQMANNNDNITMNVLILRCFHADTKCGGTADRLEPLPFVVMLAARMQRVLWIYWERPCALQEFLVPPSTGVDWRVPANVLEYYNHSLPHSPRLAIRGDILSVMDPDNYPTAVKGGRKAKLLPKVLPNIVTLIYQSNEHGADIYNQYKDEGDQNFIQPNSTKKKNKDAKNSELLQPSFEDVFRDCWKAFFQPSPPVQARIDQTMSQLGLRPNQYVAAHIRALYQQEAGPKKTALVAKNAIHCASALRTSAEQLIYVTTDSPNSLAAARAYATDTHRDVVVARNTSTTTVLHLDRGAAFLDRNSSTWMTGLHTDPVKYYDTFVDLYLLVHASCLAFHLGNYAKWANFMSDNPSCAVSHFKKRCAWKDDNFG
jgi:hypothetical protein